MHNILRRHLVVQNKYHRHKAFNDRRVAVALQFDNAVGVSPHHDPHLALTAMNRILRIAILRI